MRTKNVITKPACLHQRRAYTHISSEGRGNKIKQSFQPFHLGIKTSSVFHCDLELPRLPHIQNAQQIVARSCDKFASETKSEVCCLPDVVWKEGWSGGRAKNSKEDLNFTVNDATLPLSPIRPAAYSLRLCSTVSLRLPFPLWPMPLRRL